MIAPQANTESRLKVWRPAGFEGLEVEQFDKQEGLVIPSSVLAGHELTIALEGDALLKFAGESQRFSKIDHLFLAQHPGEVLFADTRSDNPVSVWTLRFYPELMQTLQEGLNVSTSPVFFPSMTAPDALNDTLAASTKRTIESFAEPASRLERESRLLLLMGEVLNHMADAKPPERKLGKEHKAVTLVKEVLDAHTEMDTTLSDLASLTSLNKHHLYRMFRRDVGVSPHAYQTARRVYKAKDLLHQGVTPAQVALETGFNDQSHLTHVFKKYTQVTPGRFQCDSLEKRPAWAISQ